MKIRRYTPSDLDAVRTICVRTAEAGHDATGLYSSDDLMPDIFAAPYLAFQPELAFVVEDNDGVAGYVLGVADTSAFVDWYVREWLPELMSRYERTPSVGPREDHIRDLGFSPQHMLIPEIEDYPAHLHIDLLPRLQGRGRGRALIETLSSALRERGVPGVHLGLDANNTSARAFYDRLGFGELASSTPEGPLLGMRLDGLA